MSKIPVFPFERFDITTRQTHRVYGTPEAIKSAGGTAVEGSPIEVEESKLDANGIYDPDKESETFRK